MRRLFVLLLVGVIGMGAVSMSGCMQKREPVEENIEGEAADPLKINQEMLPTKGEKSSGGGQKK